MNSDPAPPAGGSSGGAWTAAIAVIVISLLSTFTLTANTATGTGGAAANGARKTTTLKGVKSSGTTGASASGGSGSGSTGSGGGGGAAGSDPGTAGGDVVVDENGNPVVDANGNPVVASADPSVSGSAPGGGAAAAAGTTPGAISADCAAHKNAGATDQGVTATSIEFAATVVKTGIAKDFLSDAQSGMEAVRRKVNAAGGICGRQVNIKYDDDGWDPAAGNDLINKYIGCKCYFGLAVNPSSEGLRYPIENGLIDNNQFPVVGADGMLIDQYQHPWVWPVATSTHSVMHIMAHDAAARGAKTFAIVYDNKYRFGVEGHDAFVGAVKRMGLQVASDQPVQGGSQSYLNEVKSFVDKCSTSAGQFKKCDFVAMLLEPATAETWVKNGGLGDQKQNDRPAIGIGAPQPLFVTSFAVNCGGACSNLRVWTSFKPPISPFDTDPKVSEYRNDLAAVSSTADPSNPHVEGAYVGMKLLVQALQQLGAAPTRADLQTVLDSTTLDTGLSRPLQYSAGNHFAATAAQAFEAVYNVNSFTQWRYANTDFVADNEVNQDF